MGKRTWLRVHSKFQIVRLSFAPNPHSAKCKCYMSELYGKCDCQKKNANASAFIVKCHIMFYSNMISKLMLAFSRPFLPRPCDDHVLLGHQYLALKTMQSTTFKPPFTEIIPGVHT